MFLFKRKTAYEMRISVWSSDVCSSDLPVPATACAKKVLGCLAGALRLRGGGYLVRGADDRLQAGHHDVRMLAHTPGDASVGGLGLDVGNGLGIGAGADRVLVVVVHLDLDAAILAQRVHEGRDGADRKSTRLNSSH